LVEKLKYFAAMGSLFLVLVASGGASAQESVGSVAGVFQEFGDGPQDEASYDAALTKISAPELKTEILAFAGDNPSGKTLNATERLLLAEALSVHGESAFAQREFDGVLGNYDLGFEAAVRYIDICYESVLTCEQFGAVVNDAVQRTALGLEDPELPWEKHCVKLSLEAVSIFSWTNLQEANEKDRAKMLEAVWLHLASKFVSHVEEFRSVPGREAASEMVKSGYLLECVDSEIHRRPTEFSESEYYRKFHALFSSEIFSAYQAVLVWSHDS
jgi:hypothetical protein